MDISIVLLSYISKKHFIHITEFKFMKIFELQYGYEFLKTFQLYNWIKFQKAFELHYRVKCLKTLYHQTSDIRCTFVTHLKLLITQM